MAAASQAVHPPSGCTEATMVPARTPTCSQGATACQTLTAPVGSRAPPCPAQPPPRRCRRRTATAAHSRLTHTSARCCCYSSAGPAAATRTCACCCCCTSANPTAATASVTATAGARCFPGVTATGLAATALSCASAHAAAARGCPHPCARRCRHQPPARAQTHQLRPAACLAVAPPGQGTFVHRHAHARVDGRDVGVRQLPAVDCVDDDTAERVRFIEWDDLDCDMRAVPFRLEHQPERVAAEKLHAAEVALEHAGVPKLAELLHAHPRQRRRRRRLRHDRRSEAAAEVR
eukprot:350468-Chlamydomonas_euryale.AAC.16